MKIDENSLKPRRFALTFVVRNGWICRTHLWQLSSRRARCGNSGWVWRWISLTSDFISIIATSIFVMKDIMIGIWANPSTFVSCRLLNSLKDIAVVWESMCHVSWLQDVFGFAYPILRRISSSFSSPLIGSCWLVDCGSGWWFRLIVVMRGHVSFQTNTEIHKRLPTAKWPRGFQATAAGHWAKTNLRQKFKETCKWIQQVQWMFFWFNLLWEDI